MSETHGKFIWCELMTPDTSAAAKFYSSVVGWTTSEMKMEGMPTYTIFEANGIGVAGLMEFPAELEGKGIPPNWTGYVDVDDVDQSAKDFAANGGSVRRPPEDIPTIGRFAVVADPHGAVLCIMTPAPMEKPMPELAFDAPGNIGWHELYAGNGEQALAFYSKLFGWTKHSDFDMGPMGVYYLFAHNGKQIGGMMTKPENMPMPFWCYYFIVPTLDAAIERVTSGGGKVVNGPMEVPGGSWIIQATDPQGAFFCLVAPRR
ncbi:VOC family protein [Rhizobium leguminosarum]|jgi:predicted enzyme related to lactoylglutathione lyase|uniref:VOC family protein n=1 Tax=Rhizobium leguminosarum TaxID=384 RepID=UPI001031D777|nr:VOC family protein [Rhizobium leguminosarum]TAX33669.1 VOC family protein [Rhizobium leguminosarum]TAX38348.1 VOC family protein [Rhizobium leguminosarum]TAX91289.1 VOC family protein [Rhizobium leguminosarum]TAX95876.1 VOC family protein [Rhizobium leguminosarum]TAY97862.1 VOC family protein [Rhizobium leguminosarum]